MRKNNVSEGGHDELITRGSHSDRAGRSGTEECNGPTIWISGPHGGCRRRMALPPLPRLDCGREGAGDTFHAGSPRGCRKTAAARACLRSCGWLREIFGECRNPDEANEQPTDVECVWARAPPRCAGICGLCKRGGDDRAAIRPSKCGLRPRPEHDGGLLTVSVGKSDA